MTHTSVTSSFIDSIGYDAITGAMEVCFTNGSTSTHTGVSKDSYNRLMNADSIGSHYNSNFKAAATSKPKIVIKQTHFKR